MGWLSRRRTRNCRRTSGGFSPLGGIRRAGRSVGHVAAWVLPLVLSLALLVGVVWSVYRYVTTTPYFRLHTLEVSGLHRLDEQEVRDWAGLDDKTHLLGLEPANVEESLRKQPWIADSHVLRALPDRLSVRIIERKPAALLLAGSLQLVDENGIVFTTSQGRGDERLPVITGISQQELTADRSGAERRIREALAVIRQWSRQRLTSVAQLSEVHLDPVLGMVLFTEETGTRVQLGWSDHALRLARLREVLGSLKAEKSQPSYVLLDSEATPLRVTVGLKAKAQPVKVAQRPAAAVAEPPLPGASDGPVEGAGRD